MAAREDPEKSDIAVLFWVARRPDLFRLFPGRGIRNRRDVSLDRGIERRLCIRFDVAAPPRPVDAIECQRFDGASDRSNGFGIQRNVIWKAAHETDRMAIHR